MSVEYETESAMFDERSVVVACVLVSVVEFVLRRLLGIDLFAPLVVDRACVVSVVVFVLRWLLGTSLLGPERSMSLSCNVLFP